MKRLFLGVAIASALGLTGCGGDTVDELREKADILIPESHIAFDPGNADPAKRTLPLPNDLLFSGTSDGTINMPGEMADGTSDYTDPSMAIGALDGWSTTSPISITVELASDHDGKALTLDAASVFQPGAVRMFEATVGGPLSSDPECKAAPSASACKVGDELTFGVDFVSKASGSTIAIVPLKPLKANQSYIYVTTNLIQDSASQPIAASATYTSVRLDIETHPLETESQLTLQTLVNSFEKGLATAHGVDAETLSYSGLFTTQSVVDVYETTKLLMLDPTPGNPYAPSISLPQPHPLGITVAQAAGLTPADGDAYAVSNLADVYTAELTIPTFGHCDSTKCSGISGSWKALGDSPVSVLLALQAGTMSQTKFGMQAAAYGIDPTAALANPALLAGKTWLLDDDTAADKAKHLTKFNPIVQPTGQETVPVLISMPNAERVAQFSADNGLNFTPPTAGWPTTIAMHGLGGGKEMSLAYAGTYAAMGIATIAIDMPLHGARSFGANGEGVYAVSASDPSYGAVIGQPNAFANGNPLVFINIESTLSVRDNFRQATNDHLALRASLTGLAGALAQAQYPQMFDINNISAQGLSLGAIVGTNFSTYASTGVIHPESGLDLSYVYKINATSLVAPSGGFAGTFIGSATFGPLLFANVTASDTFQDLVDAANIAGYEPGSAEYAALVQAVYAGFLPTFAFAVQTAVDSADPINHAAMLKATELPIHLIEVVGDGDMHLPDQVLPNTVANFPISGTEPLITHLGLACVETTTTGASGAVRFVKGHHSSIVSPAGVEGSAAATIEMQQQVAGYALTASKGSAGIIIQDSSVIKKCP
ncbi:lipase [Shewanella sp. D64]|uniref:VolA/Pla-1 family phospholipase n=1 Tax=unclassified Shewanella TaxID=196818 RepID=UPI0022BA6514|nr:MULTISPECIES: VolA/Pla-1 family phospholipase [unclassified Shewanella]MEC4724737.1 lipase [Shewanella sp. D64]MEC4736469.1 lipase [Shewanella sp. E94]WBJ97475.1 lipase [Shewanella sp. MTB7]